ncbi:MAG: DNA-3-methyladenine glycosylase, partial [Acidimicrobiia bacterium]|nr:DNA-3-methyladenine glycosylase [Acidimicrobiia bacterium]
MELDRLVELDVVDAARRLVGATITTIRRGNRTSVMLTEAEAYHPDEPASHSHRGPTARNAPMFGPPGRLYVYRSYGIHWCANVVTRPVGSAVLLRAGEPREGLDVMAVRRGRGDHLADGPGKLTQALGIDGEDDGHDLLTSQRILIVPSP